MKRSSLSNLIFAALMTAVICIVAPIAVTLPFSAVPITLATLAVYLSSGIFGWKIGMISVGIYLLIGMVGAPVFSGFTGGIQKLFGPTGGYLAGYLFLAFFTGYFIEKFGNRLLFYILGMITGTFLCYIIGTLWLAFQLNLTIMEAVFAGVVPFLIGDIIKIGISALLCFELRKKLRFLYISYEKQ